MLNFYVLCFACNLNGISNDLNAYFEIKIKCIKNILFLIHFKITFYAKLTYLDEIIWKM